MMHNKFKRIVLMANDVDRLGGVGRFMERMAVEFHDRGFAVELVGVTPPPPEEKQIVDRPAAIVVRELWSERAPENWTLKRRRDQMNPLRRKRNAKRRSLRKAAVLRLRELLLEWGPDTLIICTQVFGMEHLKEAGYNPSDQRMPRVVGQYHGSYSMCVQTRDLGRVVRGYSEVEKFVCLNAEDARLFRAASLNNATWIANPVETPKAEPSERENVFVALGRYDKQKSLDYLLRAWNSIAAELPNWRVDLYGEGLLRADLERQIVEEKIPRANLKGKTNEVGMVLSKSKIHVLSSQYEGLPIAIVEAGLLGVPTIAFDCAPGISDLIEDGFSGTIVPQNSALKLAEAMLTLAKDAESLDAMSKASIIHSQRFSPDVVVEQWLGLMSDMSR